VAKKLGFGEDEFEAVLRLPNRRHEQFATDASLRGRYFRVLAVARPLRVALKALNRR